MPPRSLAASLSLALLLPYPPAADPGIAPEVVRLPDPASPRSCAERRRLVAAELWNGVLALESGSEPEDGRFHPDDDFHWIAGVDAPDAAVVLVARQGELASETLYLPRRDPVRELWSGPRLAPGEEAVRLSGIEDTRLLDVLEADVEALAAEGLTVLAAGPRLGPLATAEPGDGEPALSPRRFLRDIQVVKDAAEIAATRAAVDITQAALREAMRVAVPGAWEFTAEAAVEGGFRRRGASQRAFPSICGSGPNSCILHYRANERRLAPGDLLVMDVGAKFHHYCADVTRTIPVSGRFTERQREVYELVYEASRRAAAELAPGARLRDAEAVARAFLEERGFDRKDFPHSIGHGLGLEVHDAPARGDVLRPGMVVTIEPGIYLPGEEIGIRIEDDYLITEEGAELLSDDLPAAPDELEALLAELRAP